MNAFHWVKFNTGLGKGRVFRYRIAVFTAYSDYLKTRFGGRTYKVVVSSQLTCPTRDGSLAKNGCAFCDVRGSSSFYGKKGRGADVVTQIRSRIPGIRERFQADHLLAYFQSYTNTYSDAEHLRELYDAALSVPEIEGLCIGTRPDCLSDGVIALLEEFGRRTYLSLELGVQSFYDPSLEWFVRGHDAQCSRDALKRLRAQAPHVHTCAHLMFGAPPEGNDPLGIARAAALELNTLGVRGVKLHQLMVLENTDMADWYRKEPFPVLSLEQYAEQIAVFLEHLDPAIYVERLYATATHPEECIAPEWSRERWRPHNELRRILGERGTRQGLRL